MRPLVIALGPGFTAGVDCHVVVETNRGHRLGRPIYEGAAEPDTGRPGVVGGKTAERILRAPVTGVVTSWAAIGDRVVEGQVVAVVGGSRRACRHDGGPAGLVRDGTVPSKIGDVDPRAAVRIASTISEKALASPAACWKPYPGQAEAPDYWIAIRRSRFRPAMHCAKRTSATRLYVSETSDRLVHRRGVGNRRRTVCSRSAHR